jgi:hypothetical protein
MCGGLPSLPTSFLSSKRALPHTRRLPVVPCDGALGVCRDARISRIAGGGGGRSRQEQPRAASLAMESTLERPGSVCGRNVKPGEM